MKKTATYSLEVCERAVRMVLEHLNDHPSEWAAIEAIAPKIGYSAQILHGWIRHHQTDPGYTGVEKRPEHEGRQVIWQVAAQRSTYKKLDKRVALYKARRKIEEAKAQIRAKAEHPIRVIKRQFGYTKVRLLGLVKNTAQLVTLVTLFALSNLWMTRRHLLAIAGEVRL